MRIRKGRIGLIAGMLAMAWVRTAAAEPMDAGKAVVKLSRGAVNIVTGWVEIPKRMHETTKLEGPVSGFTWGLIRGIGYGCIRTLAGAYEAVTFPYPAPPGYTSVIEPEFVFTDDDTGRPAREVK